MQLAHCAVLAQDGRNELFIYRSFQEVHLSPTDNHYSLQENPFAAKAMQISSVCCVRLCLRYVRKQIDLPCPALDLVTNETLDGRSRSNEGPKIPMAIFLDLDF